MMSKNLSQFNNQNGKRYKKGKTLKIKNKTYTKSVNLQRAKEEEGTFSPQKIIEGIPETELIANYKQTTRQAQKNSQIYSFGETPQFKNIGSPKFSQQNLNKQKKN